MQYECLKRIKHFWIIFLHQWLLTISCAYMNSINKVTSISFLKRPGGVEIRIYWVKNTGKTICITVLWCKWIEKTENKNTSSLVLGDYITKLWDFWEHLFYRTAPVRRMLLVLNPPQYNFWSLFSVYLFFKIVLTT